MGENKLLIAENEEYKEQMIVLKHKMNMMEMDHQEMLIKQRKICMELQNQNNTLSQMLLIKQKSLTEALMAVDQHTNELVVAQGRNSQFQFMRSSVKQSPVYSVDEDEEQINHPRKNKKISMKFPDTNKIEMDNDQSVSEEL